MTESPANDAAEGRDTAADEGKRRFFGLLSGSSAEEYQYNHSYVAPVAMVDKLPRDEKPSLTWYVHCCLQSLRIAYNRLHRCRPSQASDEGGPVVFSDDGEAPGATALNMDHLGLPPMDLKEMPPDEREIEDDVDVPDGDGPVPFLDNTSASDRAMMLAATQIARKVADTGTRNPLEVMATVLKSLFTHPAGRPTSLDDYRGLFGALPLPWTAERFQEDAVFAWLRVAGANPLVIRQVAALDASFPVTDALFKASLGDESDSLAAAGGEGRLFLADYARLARVEHGNFPAGPKYLHAPKVLFALPRGTGPRRLRPIAIQCGQDPKSYPVFTPADGPVWLKAKVVVECADNNHHELVSHLGRTHFLVSPFAIATRRRLRDDHPISLLLRPHFEGTLSINDCAQATLIAKGHEVDKSLAGTIEASRRVAAESLADYPFNDAFLPVELAARGVMSPDLDYPYRDDALLIWDAIGRWVEAYVKLHYAADADVAADKDLAAWGAELVAKDGGRVLGFGERGDGRLTTIAYLTKALTMLIFTASAQHAAVNFPQAELLSYTPASPFALYRAAPLSHDDSELSPYLDLFPPLELAELQMEFLNLLGGVHYTRLGEYRALWFKDFKVIEPLRRFQQELKDISATIAKRNQTRFGPYPFLLPEQIPQSTNI